MILILMILLVKLRKWTRKWLGCYLQEQATVISASNGYAIILVCPTNKLSHVITLIWSWCQNNKQHYFWYKFWCLNETIRLFRCWCHSNWSNLFHQFWVYIAKPHSLLSNTFLQHVMPNNSNQFRSWQIDIISKNFFCSTIFLECRKPTLNWSMLVLQYSVLRLMRSPSRLKMKRAQGSGFY